LPSKDLWVLFLHRHRPIRAEFSGGQIGSDAGLLPLRAIDQRYGRTRGLAEHLCDPREEERVRHSVLSLFRQRLYQIIAGYEDADDADRLRHDPATTSTSRSARFSLFPRSGTTRFLRPS
jgi:hypothetical protein